MENWELIFFPGLQLNSIEFLIYFNINLNSGEDSPTDLKFYFLKT